MMFDLSGVHIRCSNNTVVLKFSTTRFVHTLHCNLVVGERLRANRLNYPSTNVLL